MKGKLFIAGLALLALASCNKEDGTTLVNNDAQGQYLAVNLSMTGSAATKAWDPTAFENLTANDPELQVTKALFLFFKDNTQCADAFDASKDLTWTDENTTNHGPDDSKSSTIIVLKNPTAVPTSIVALLNLDDATKAKAEASTLTGLSEIILEGAAILLISSNCCKFISTVSPFFSSSGRSLNAY